MTHTLPDLGSLFAETKYLVKSYFWDFSKVIVPGLLLPLIFVGVSLCFCVDLSLGALGAVILLEGALLCGLFAVFIPKVTAVALAASYGEEPNFSRLPIWRYVGMTLLLSVPSFVVQEGLKLVGLRVLSLPVSAALFYVSLRLTLSVMILVAGEGGVWCSIVRSWNLLRSVAMRFFFYRLAIAAPAAIVTVVLSLVMIFTFLSNVRPLNYESLLLNLPVILGAIILGIVPGLAFNFYFITALDAVVYRWLTEQEKIGMEDESPVAVTG